jgi:hypothetical protein
LSKTSDEVVVWETDQHEEVGNVVDVFMKVYAVLGVVTADEGGSQDFCFVSGLESVGEVSFVLGFGA